MSDADRLGAREWATRLLALVLAAGVVVGVAAGGAAVADDDQESTDEALAIPEYQPDNVSVEYIPAEGEVTPSRDAVVGSGTVVIDAGHGNRYDRTTIEPLVRGLTRVGYDVEIYRTGDLAETLEGAKAFVVIDPSQEYRPGDVDDVRRFTGQGGRLLIVGEPNRISVSASLFGSSITTQESALTTLGAAYGTSVGTAYLYNQESADANYKHLTTRPTDAEGLDGIDRTTMYTAGAVRMRGGETLLRSAPGTVKSTTDDEQGRHPVAARRNDVVVLGDKSFMRADRYRVADNEAFVTYLVEFLASGDRDTSRSLTSGEETTESPTENTTVAPADTVDVD
ncbi:MAG: DUF4350 domain-containing protein [Haloferacaceae archaeon]